MSKVQHLNAQDEVTEERLEKALQVLSGIVAEHGEQHQPLHDFIKAQLDSMQAKKKAKERVRRLSAAIGQLADVS